VKCKDCDHTLKGTREYLLAFFCKHCCFQPVIVVLLNS
jgi:hypothetical protein